MMTRHKWISIFLLLFSFNLISAQSNELAATVTIIADDVWFIRTNTSSEFPLSPGAIAPFGIGDTIVTGENGRALILPGCEIRRFFCSRIPLTPYKNLRKPIQKTSFFRDSWMELP